MNARIVLFFNWDSLYARLNSHYKAWSYKKNKQKDLRYTGNLFRKNLQYYSFFRKSNLKLILLLNLIKDEGVFMP